MFVRMAAKCTRQKINNNVNEGYKTLKKKSLHIVYIDIYIYISTNILPSTYVTLYSYVSVNLQSIRTHTKSFRPILIFIVRRYPNRLKSRNNR